jgi:hypothetical protein
MSGWLSRQVVCFLPGDGLGVFSWREVWTFGRLSIAKLSGARSGHGLSDMRAFLGTARASPEPLGIHCEPLFDRLDVGMSSAIKAIYYNIIILFVKQKMKAGDFWRA